MTPSPPSFHLHSLARPSILRTKQSWSSIPWLAAISCPRSGCKATTGAGRSRSPAPKSNWRRIIIRRRSSSSQPRSPAEASAALSLTLPGFGPSPRGKKAWSNASRNAWTVPSFFFLHFIRPLGLHLCPHLSNIKRKLQDSGPQFHQLLAPRDEAVNYRLVAHPKMRLSEGSYALPVQQNSGLP